MFALLLLFPLVTGVFYGDNKEFFDQAAKERAMGAEWHYVCLLYTSDAADE